MTGKRRNYPPRIAYLEGGSTKSENLGELGNGCKRKTEFI
jgi:hypothetical protein